MSWEDDWWMVAQSYNDYGYYRNSGGLEYIVVNCTWILEMPCHSSRRRCRGSSKCACEYSNEFNRLGSKNGRPARHKTPSNATAIRRKAAREIGEASD